MSSVLKALLTAQEYLARERKAAFKSEFYLCEMFAMAGASWEHNLIALNVAAEARHQLKDSGCQVASSDLRVKVEVTGLYTYPDVIVVCDEPQFEDDVLDTLLNPRVLVEVLSDSTEKYDRGDKFKHYQQVPALQEFILIAQDQALVERHVRQDNGDWLTTEYRSLELTLALTSVPVRIALTEIYRGVKLPENAGP